MTIKDVLYLHDAQVKAEWYATGILDSGTDPRVTEQACIDYGKHYRAITDDFASERRPDLPNVRSAWPAFIGSYEVVVTTG